MGEETSLYEVTLSILIEANDENKMNNCRLDGTLCYGVYKDAG